jgi:YihY family inner membrane protein
MSTASVVPETIELSGDDAYRTLREAHVGVLLKDSFDRVRAADGFSHARALAFQCVLTMLPGVIVAVGVAVTFNSAVGNAIRDTIDSLAPGPAGDLFRAAFDQGASKGTGVGHGARALLFGGIAMFISGVTAFGQVERAANRIYGVETDRPSLRKYGRAIVLTLTAGILLTGFFVAIALGRWVSDAISEGSVERSVWPVLRWPIGAALLAGAVGLIFRYCPKRRHPCFSWLVIGSAIAIALITVVSVVFHAYLDLSNSFGETYGPVAGFIGLMMWTYLSALSLLYGMAFAAQLEAVRAGRHEPRSEAKAAEGETGARSITAEPMPLIG